MIKIDALSKSFRLRHGRKTVIDDLTLTIPGGRSVGLLGRNGAGKSTLLQIIAGTVRPDAGQVVTKGSVSWPVGFGNAFHCDLTGAQNVRFVGRIYGVDSDELIDFVEDFCGTGRSFPHADPKLFDRHALPTDVRAGHGHPLRYLPCR